MMPAAAIILWPDDRPSFLNPANANKPHLLWRSFQQHLASAHLANIVIIMPVLSCHALLHPVLLQGANQGVQDAVALAARLGQVRIGSAIRCAQLAPL